MFGAARAPMKSPIDTVQGAEEVLEAVSPTRVISTTPVKSYPVTFTGSGSEYFPIWLSNLALTIITIGLYAPWAKVRRERYFLGNTWLNDTTFDYTADPKKILWGRLIVVAIFFLYSVFVGYLPMMEYPLLVLLFLTFAWAFVQALRFRCRNTCYRGLRFNFTGNFRQSLVVNIGWKFLGFVTLGMLYPVAKHRSKQFMINHLNYGTSPFRLNSRVSQFYLAYGMVMGALLVLGVLLGVASLPFVSAFELLGSEEQENASLAIIFFGVFLLYALALVFILPALNCLTNKLAWNGTALKGFTVKYDLQLLRYLFIGVTNLLIIVLTLGILYPIAKVRMYKYKVSRLSVDGVQSPDDFIKNEEQEVSALGDQMLGDFDVGLDVGF